MAGFKTTPDEHLADYEKLQWYEKQIGTALNAWATLNPDKLSKDNLEIRRTYYAKFLQANKGELSTKYGQATTPPATAPSNPKPRTL